MTIGTWVLLIVIVVAIIGILVGGRKRRWYKVYFDNLDVVTAYRKMGDWWWRDTSGMMAFRTGEGKRIKFGVRHIVKVEELDYEVEEAE